MRNPVVLLIVSFFILQTTTAQQEADKIFMQSGVTHAVSIKKILPETIIYCFIGENLENEVVKEDVLKIIFKNGREQVFNASGIIAKGSNYEYPQMKVNEGAILPFAFVFDSVVTDEEGVEAQEFYYNNLMRKPERNTISYQNPETTQRRLRSAGISSAAQYQDYQMSDIAKILGVGVVVTGKITVDYRSTTTNSYGSTTVKVDSKKKKGKVYSSDYSTSKEEFDTKVLFRIYDKDGKKIVDVTRRPFMATTRNNYITALNYLMKRTPYYVK